MVLAIVAVPVAALAIAIYRSVRHQPSIEWWVAVAVWLATIGVWYAGKSLWLAGVIGMALMLAGLFTTGRRGTK